MMKKIILTVSLIMSLGHTSSLLDKYLKITDNKMSKYLEKEMYSEAVACENGVKISCIRLGIGAFSDSAWRAKELLSYFTYSGIVKKNVKKKLKNKILKIKKSQKRLTKSQIINNLTKKSDRKNLNKTGIYKITFKDGSVYIGKAVKQTIEQRLKNRNKNWLLSIKSIEAKYFPKSQVDRVERSIIGGATRFERIRYNPYSNDYNRRQSIYYRNDKFNRIKHPKTKSKYFWEE
jgi:hypothetical protein